MHSVRGTVRSLLLLACAVLLAVSGCVMAYHDGLPAWTPPAGQTEGSIGYHQVLSPGSGGSAWYLTPGARFGLLQPPLAGDFGLNSVVVVGGGSVAAMLGPALGIGYQTEGFCFVVRPSAYMVGVSEGGVHFGFTHPRWQVSMLAGNSAQSGRTHVSGGGRASEFAAGPVLLVDHSLGSVNLRLEGSYMLPYGGYSYEAGQLTLGLTVAAPAPQSGDWPSISDY